MHRSYLLVVTALGEGCIALLLLASPAILQWLLLRVEPVSPEAGCFARVAGAALLAFSVACWLGRSDPVGSAALGLMVGTLIYDVGAAVILAYAGLILSMVGIALWPAVVLHAGLAIWCITCLPKGGRKAARFEQ